MSGIFTIDETVTYEEALTYQGKTCRVGTGWQMLSNANDYLTLHFHTPVSGTVFYAFSTIQKTGGEVEITIVEGGTYTGGTPTSTWKLHRKYRHIPCQFTDIKYGVYPAATISGGLSAPPNGIPGTSTGGVGGTKAGGSQEGGKFIILENDMDYTLKVTALEANTKILALTTLAHS